MKTLVSLLAAGLLALATGCSTVDSRISKSSTEFQSWPADVQAKIRAGQVDVGFTPEQVEVALGEPEKKYTRKTAKGTAEVWAYTKSSGFSLGLGVGAVGGSGGYGGGVGYDTTSRGGDDERVRVIFEAGLVTSVETREK
jgi:hypothetical protein